MINQKMTSEEWVEIEKLIKEEFSIAIVEGLKKAIGISPETIKITISSKIKNAISTLIQEKQKEAIEAVLPDVATQELKDDTYYQGSECKQEMGYGFNTCCQQVIQNAKEKLNIEIK